MERSERVYRGRWTAGEMTMWLWIFVIMDITALMVGSEDGPFGSESRARVSVCGQQFAGA